MRIDRHQPIQVRAEQLRKRARAYGLARFELAVLPQVREVGRYQTYARGTLGAQRIGQHEQRHRFFVRVIERSHDCDFARAIARDAHVAFTIGKMPRFERQFARAQSRAQSCGQRFISRPGAEFHSCSSTVMNTWLLRAYSSA